MIFYGGSRRNAGTRIVVTIGAIGVFLRWEFGIKAPLAKRQAWEGTLVETQQSRRWWKGLKHSFDSEHEYYNYYWVVKCTDGKTRTAEVPWGFSTIVKPGDPILKVKGKRWPELNTLQAIRDREIKQEVLDTVFK